MAKIVVCLMKPLQTFLKVSSSNWMFIFRCSNVSPGYEIWLWFLLWVLLPVGFRLGRVSPSLLALLIFFLYCRSSFLTFDEFVFLFLPILYNSFLRFAVHHSLSVLFLRKSLGISCSSFWTLIFSHLSVSCCVTLLTLFSYLSCYFFVLLTWWFSFSVELSIWQFFSLLFTPKLPATTKPSKSRTPRSPSSSCSSDARNIYFVVL